MEQKRSYSLFVVEDDEYFRELIDYTVNLNRDIVSRTFGTAKELEAALIEKPDIVTLDYCMPDKNGDEILKMIKNYSPDTDVIVISEQERIETAVDLLQLGAFDYIVKGDEMRSRLLNTLRLIIQKRLLQFEINSLKTQLNSKYDFGNLVIGQSQVMSNVFRLMSKAAETSINVCLTGETGTGKEVVARAIHFNSEKKGGPFIAVNMAAIPAELIESELFGHERGAYTGASTQRLGRFEQANEGTLFLDEIGEMPLEMQAKLLRVLQERSFYRVGGSKETKTNCRILTATHRDLADRVEKELFREDLYYRLKGLMIELPALREREEDIVLLAQSFVAEFSELNKIACPKITLEAKKKLMGYSFPGNVRELKSIIDLAVVLMEKGEITEESIVLEKPNFKKTISFVGKNMKELHNEILEYNLQKYHGNALKVAEVLDIGKSTVYRYLNEKQKDYE